MSYTATAIVGNHLLSHFSSKVGLNRIITLACLSAACFQIALILSRGLFSFTLMRMLQVGFIAGSYSPNLFNFCPGGEWQEGLAF